MRGWVLALESLAVACSTSTSGDDAGCTGPWNALIPTTTQYDFAAGAGDAGNCVGDPSTHSGGVVHPLGCTATTTQTSGSDIRCDQHLCGCTPLTCHCQFFVPDAGPQWICPN